jgi:hypothetical protein
MKKVLFIIWAIIWIPLILLAIIEWTKDIIKKVKKRNYSGLLKPLFYIIFSVIITSAGLNGGLSTFFNFKGDVFHWIYENGLQILFYVIWTPLSLWVTYQVIIYLIKEIKKLDFGGIFGGGIGFPFVHRNFYYWVP